MAKIGGKYPAYGLGSYTSGTKPTFSKGKFFGKLISANFNPSYNDTTLYGDDTAVESDKTFSKGELSINVDDFGETWEEGCQIIAEITGGTLSDDENQITFGGNDTAPYVGVGYISKGRQRNIPYYEANVFYKVQFSGFGGETKTKEESITFDTPTVDGTVMTLDDQKATFRDMYRFATEEEALEKLKEIFNITTNSENL